VCVVSGIYLPRQQIGLIEILLDLALDTAQDFNNPVLSYWTYHKLLPFM